VRYVIQIPLGISLDATPHTFLFADLVGFTKLTEDEGDERAAEVGLTLQRCVRPLLAAYDAQQVKAWGDGLMLRAQRPGAAIELGLRLVDEVDADPALPSIRVGMHTGTAVERDGDWYGRAVNIAARLCAASSGGLVLVSETTRAAAGPMRKVKFGDRRLHWLRNVTEPVVAHLVFERTCRFRPRRPNMSARAWALQEVA
jgi:adenylate cyclase